MKILFIINVLQGGGRERRMIQLIKSLSLDNNYHISLVVLTDSTKVDYPEIYETGCKITFLSDDGSFINYGILYEEVREFQPDIVHCWCMNSSMLYHLIKAKMKCKFVLIAGFVADGNRIPVFTTEFVTTQMSFLLSDHIISNSLAGLKAKHAPMFKSSVIHNGFDFNRFSKDFDYSRKRAELGLSNDAFVISMIARFNAAKDWDSFIRSAELFKKDKNVYLLAVGKGETLQSMIDKAQKLDLTNISFLGFRKDVEDLMRISNVTMLWSNEKVHAEGISNSIMESMAAGVPVIASRGGGTGEIIVDGENGFIVSPGDAEAAVKVINKLLSNKEYYNEICLSAKRHISENFLLSQMAENYKNLYKHL